MIIHFCEPRSLFVKPVTRYALVFMLALGAPFFFFWGPGYYSSQSFKNAWDLGHVLFFTLAAVGLSDFFSSRNEQLSIGAIFWRVFFIVFCVGMAVEFVQGYVPGRSASGFDILRNQFGACTGLTIYFSRIGKLPRWAVAKLQAAVLVLLLILLWPLTRAMIDERRAAQQFPVLSDFETRFEHRRWQNVNQLKIVDEPVRHGKKSLRVPLTTSRYSGVQLFYFPHDWSRYTILHFSIYKDDDQEMVLYGKIYDRLHKDRGRIYSDRYNKKFRVEPGWNDFQISLDEVRHAPATREMNMHKIVRFALFVVSQTHPRVLYLDHVYLSK